MIVREHPSTLKLFFVMQGSVVPKILGRIIGIALLTIVVVLVDQHIVTLPHISIGAMGIFGVALSLFLGFRNNAAYDRWWEARKLWGAMIAYKNPADAALRSMADKIGKLIKEDAISGFGQMTISQTLSSLALAQAGCERIFTTPLPFVYSLLVRRTTYLYCWLLPFALIEATGWFAPVFAAVVAYVFFGLQAVTNELELPFRNAQNGLPLDAMCRTIEISVSEALDRTPPPAWSATNHVLS